MTTTFSSGCGPASAADPRLARPGAIVSSLSDDTSARIARFLLEKGADQEITTPDGYSPRWFAEDRDKTLLLNVLVAQDR